MAEEPTRVGEDEVALEAVLLWGMKKVSSGASDTLRRDAVKRADSAVCGGVISCSRGQERRRTELELGSRKSIENHHGAATFRTAPKRARFLGGRCLLFYLRWRDRAE